MNPRGQLGAFVYRTLAEGPPRTASTLAALLGGSLTSVRRYLTRLQREGRVDVVARRTTRRGGSAALWGLPAVCCEFCGRSMDEYAARDHCCPATPAARDRAAVTASAEAQLAAAEAGLAEARIRWKQAAHRLQRVTGGGRHVA